MSEQGNMQRAGDGWKTNYLLGGAVVGALVGVATAYFMVRNAEETHGGPPQIKSSDIIKSGVGVVGLVRAIASLGE